MPSKNYRLWRRCVALLALVSAVLLSSGVPSYAATGTASISGTIEAPQGTDLTRVYVQAVSATSGSGSGVGADGAFSMTALAAGSYTLHVSGPELISQSVGPINLQDGQTLTGVKISMERGATISGKVTGASLEDLNSLHVSIFDTSGSRVIANGGFINADGTFTASGLPAGTYKVRVEDNGHYIYNPTLTFVPPKYASQWYSGQYAMSAAETITVTAGSTKTGVDMALVLGGSISGHVQGLGDAAYACVAAFALDAAVSPAVAGAGDTSGSADTVLTPQAAVADPCYDMRTKDAVSHTAADASGNYTLHGLPPGSYRIYQAVPFSYGPAGQQATSRAPQWFGGKILKDTGTEVSVPLAGAVSGIDMVSFPERVFTDIPAGTQFHREISWLGSTGISTGYPNGTYAPLSSVNRDAMAAFLYRLAGSPDFTPPSASPFTDVATNNQFYKQITWLAAQEISTGWTEEDGTKTYRPLQSVNRDAMAAFLYRFAGKPAFTPPATSPFADVATNNQFYSQITWLANTGITTGWAEGNGTKTFRPVSAVNRDAMAAFLYRFGSWTGSIR